MIYITTLLIQNSKNADTTVRVAYIGASKVKNNNYVFRVIVLVETNAALSHIELLRLISAYR